jgi:hypothetical protein
MEVNDLKKLFPRFNVDTYDHVLGHIAKALGRLYALSGDADHIQASHPGMSREEAFRQAEQNNVSVCDKTAEAYISDLGICMAKLSELCPSGAFDLEKAILARMAEKRSYLDQYLTKRS